MKHLKKLTILHSNDMHGAFLPEGEEGNMRGGVSLLSGYVSHTRREEPNTLYCIAGDMFRGSIIDEEFKGISTIEIINMLAPDVVTLGNHEVDYGIAHILFLEKCARFPIINANMHITLNNAHLFQSHCIKNVDGMTILFIGILTEETLTETRKDALIGTLVDIAEAVEEIGRICNAYRSIDVDCTILLTHIGYEEDKRLAAELDPAWGVDIIIGGHSHTTPEEAIRINDILIVQAGSGTNYIGRMDIQLDLDNNCVDSYTWKMVPIEQPECPRDFALERVVDTYRMQTDAKYGRVITRFARTLTHPERNRETELGNLTADILRESLGVDIVMPGSGSIRVPAMGPVVTLGDLMEAFPFDDQMYMVTVTGKQLREMVKYTLRDEVWEGVHSEFYQYSKGVGITYDRKSHAFLRFDYNGKPLEDEALIRLGIAEYHYSNFEQFFHVPLEEVEKNGKGMVVSTSWRQIIEEYLVQHYMLDCSVEGRLIIQ